MGEDWGSAKDSPARQPVGGCPPVYFGHGQRRHRSGGGDGVPQGSRATHQGDSELDALARYDRRRELPRPSYATLCGARHDRSRVPRGQAAEGSLTCTHSGEDVPHALSGALVAAKQPQNRSFEACAASAPRCRVASYANRVACHPAPGKGGCT
jgi:hypothetical protein